MVLARLSQQLLHPSLLCVCFSRSLPPILFFLDASNRLLYQFIESVVDTTIFCSKLSLSLSLSLSRIFKHCWRHRPTLTTIETLQFTNWLQSLEWKRGGERVSAREGERERTKAKADFLL